MPQIVESEVLPIYKDYTISENINVVPCVMSSIQWLQYLTRYNRDKLNFIKKLGKGDLYGQKSDFNIRTRQICNMIYENDEFRIKNNEVLKKVYDSMIKDGILEKEKIKQFITKIS